MRKALRLKRRNQKSAPAKTGGKVAKAQVDGEEVELEEVDLEDLESLEKELVSDNLEGVENIVDSERKEKPAEPEDDRAGFTLTASEEDDLPAQTVVTAGATADPVKDYLKQIGRVPLLNAEQEVELAKRVEAGLFAEETLNSGEKFEKKLKRELDWIAEDGRRAKNHLLEANLRLVVSLAKRYTGRGMLFLDLIRGKFGPYSCRRKIRLHQGLQVLDLCDLVDSPGDYPRDGRPGPHHPYPSPHG